jgi:hypothetical protein
VAAGSYECQRHSSSQTKHVDPNLEVVRQHSDGRANLESTYAPLVHFCNFILELCRPLLLHRLMPARLAASATACLAFSASLSCCLPSSSTPHLSLCPLPPAACTTTLPLPLLQQPPPCYIHPCCVVQRPLLLLAVVVCHPCNIIVIVTVNNTLLSFKGC